MSVFFVLPFQSAVVKVFIFRSDAIVNCGSQHRILCGCICLTSFIIWSVYMYVSCWYCFHDYVLFIAFDCVITFQVASVQFVFIIQMGWPAVGIDIVYCEVTIVLHYPFIHVYFIAGTVSGSVAMWLCLMFGENFNRYSWYGQI